MRPTLRPTASDAAPMRIAVPPNTNGNHERRLNTSSMTRSDVARYEEKDPNTATLANVYNSAARLRTIAMVATATWRSCNGWRRSTGSVSGSRSDHTARITPNAAHTTNVPRHGMNLINPAPRTGAKTGTHAKTVIANAISRAMSAPTNRSRIAATAMTLRPAAPRPHTNRAIRIEPSVG